MKSCNPVSLAKIPKCWKLIPWFPHFRTDKFPWLFQYILSMFQYFFSVLFNEFNIYKNLFNKYTSIKKLQKKYKYKLAKTLFQYLGQNSPIFSAFWVKFPDLFLTGKSFHFSGFSSPRGNHEFRNKDYCKIFVSFRKIAINWNSHLGFFSFFHDIFILF